MTKHKKAELLNKYFASVFETEGPGPLPEFPDRNFIEALSTIEITTDNIKKAILKLKPSKSQGTDNLHPKVIKECSDQLMEPLKHIFTKSLEESKLPDIWKQANITAIHKSGEKKNSSRKLPTHKSVICTM